MAIELEIVDRVYICTQACRSNYVKKGGNRTIGMELYTQCSCSAIAKYVGPTTVRVEFLCGHQHITAYYFNDIHFINEVFKI